MSDHQGRSVVVPVEALIVMEGLVRIADKVCATALQLEEAAAKRAAFSSK